MPHQVPEAWQPRSRPLHGKTAVFLHAHPDDEAIFTGGTIRRLADAGARVVLVCATNGGSGNSLTALDRTEALPARRLIELELACAELGVYRLVPTGYRDSGMTGDRANRHPQAFCRARTATVARWLANLCEAEGAETLVHYDPGGIYPHPDHLKVHLVGAATAAIMNIATYEATVDRQVLGNDARHLVHRPELG